MLHPPRRLFIGLIPDRHVQMRIQRHCRDWEWPETARPTRFGRYHLTLHFLGEVGAAPEHALRQALRGIPMQPLELVLTTPQAWRHGIAVLCPDAHQGLVALRQRIAQVVPSASQAAPAAFTPHVTLARAADAARTPAAHPCIRWTAREFLLVWSLLPPQAKPARYEVLERFGARAGAPCAPSGQPGEQLGLFA